MPEDKKLTPGQDGNSGSKVRVQALRKVRVKRNNVEVILKARQVVEKPWPELLKQAKNDHNLKVF